MYLQEPDRGYTRDGQQRCRKAPFLLLIQTTYCDDIYGVVRKVALKQCGHFMMGRVKILGKSYFVSGSYGNDGLMMTVDIIPPDAKRLPDELRAAWNSAGSEAWNSAGSEAPLLVEWARRELLK